MSGVGSAISRELLELGLIRLGISTSESGCEKDKVCDKLYRYLREVERWNRRFNLVRADGKDLVVRHLLDSLSVYRFLADKRKNLDLLDIGSGAGFPGIPLSVVFPDFRFVLLERMEKKAAFLKNIVFEFGLLNVKVVCDDLKNLSSRKSFYDVVTFRAFSKLEKILGFVVPLLNDNGFIMAYKGKLDTLKEEISALSVFFKHMEINRVSVPFMEAERHILVAKKKDYFGRS